MFEHLKVKPLVLQETKWVDGWRWDFVGSTPADLAYETDAQGEERSYLFRTAAICGPGLAREIAAKRGFTFRKRSWSTEADALAAAAEIGAQVTQICPHDPKAWRTTT
jgi:hypothetical protein